MRDTDDNLRVEFCLEGNNWVYRINLTRGNVESILQGFPMADRLIGRASSSTDSPFFELYEGGLEQGLPTFFSLLPGGDGFFGHIGKYVPGAFERIADPNRWEEVEGVFIEAIKTSGRIPIQEQIILSDGSRRLLNLGYVELSMQE
jgi:hypothetical protein